MSKLKYMLLLVVGVSIGLSAWITLGQDNAGGQAASTPEEVLLQQTQGMNKVSTDSSSAPVVSQSKPAEQSTSEMLPEELAPKKETTTPADVAPVEIKPAPIALPEELAPKKEEPAAVTESPKAAEAAKPVEVAPVAETIVPATPVLKKEEPAAVPGTPAITAVEKPVENATIAVVPETKTSTLAPAAVESSSSKGGEEVWDRRSKDAQTIAQQEEIRRKAKTLEAKKNVEKADLAYKNKDYGSAINFYGMVLRDVPAKGDYLIMRKKATDRIPECEYRTVLSLTKEGRTKEAYDLGLAYQETNKVTNIDSPDLDKIVARLKDEVAVQAKKSSVQRTAIDIKDAETKKRADVQTLMKEGRELLSNRDYEKAKGRFEAILAIDPSNKDAMKYLADIAQRKAKASTLERTATSKSMVAGVRAAWNPPDYKEIKPPPQTTTTNKATESALINKMKEIIIPEIEFRQANIHDVVDFLNKASIEGDKNVKENEPKRGVNLILNLGQAATAPAAAAPAGGEGAGFPGGDAAGGAAGSDAGLQKYNITFTARYISMKEALDIITSIAGLKYRAQGNVVMITSADFTDDEIISRWYPVEPTFMTRISEVGASMAQKQLGKGSAGEGGGFVSAEGGGGGTQSDIKQQFITLGIPFPGQATISYNPTISKVFIANTAENIAKFEALLNELNVVPSQVEIEARFVEINETELDELGVEWLLNDNWEVAQKKNYPAGTPVSARERVVVNQNNNDNGFTKGLRFWGNSSSGDSETMSGGSMGKVLSISSILTNPQLTFILHALEQKGHADVLSAPKITTRSGVEASIRVVTEYIYPTEFDVQSGSDAGNNNNNANGAVVQQNTFVSIPQSFEMREVGVILTVLPEVSPNGGTINLTMTPQVVTEPTWQQYGSVIRHTDGSEDVLNMPQPFFHTRTLTTQISIYDGATVVMGGLITEALTTVDDRIPLLGDIPLIGRLFRTNSQKSEKKNLLIFVTASLVDPGGKLIRKTSEDIATAAAAPVATPTK